MGFWDQLTGSAAADTANAAAADQYGKQRQAAEEARSAGRSYLEGLNTISRNYDPYAQSGNAALQRLMAGLGLGGDTAGFAAAYKAIPGYQEGMTSGANAVTTNLNANRGVNNGAAMKALYRFGSDYENQRSGDYLTRLMGLSTTGLGATDAQSKMQAQGQGGFLQGNLAGAQMQYGAAPTIGQGMIAGANAEAAGAQNLMNTGINLAGRLMGMPGGMGGMGGFGSSFGGASQGPSAFMGAEGSNPWMKNASWGAIQNG